MCSSHTHMQTHTLAHVLSVARTSFPPDVREEEGTGQEREEPFLRKQKQRERERSGWPISVSSSNSLVLQQQAPLLRVSDQRKGNLFYIFAVVSVLSVCTAAKDRTLLSLSTVFCLFSQQFDQRFKVVARSQQHHHLISCLEPGSSQLFDSSRRPERSSERRL